MWGGGSATDVQALASVAQLALGIEGKSLIAFTRIPCRSKLATFNINNITKLRKVLDGAETRIGAAA